jgi:hypothetical protein
MQLEKGTNREEVGEAEHSTHGNKGLDTACKQNISMIKNISIESSGIKEKYLFDLRKTMYAFTEEEIKKHLIWLQSQYLIIIIIIIITTTIYA